jgi:hypothetical protein
MPQAAAAEVLLAAKRQEANPLRYEDAPIPRMSRMTAADIVCCTVCASCALVRFTRPGQPDYWVIPNAPVLKALIVHRL